jgi:hypothetical protein
MDQRFESEPEADEIDQMVLRLNGYTREKNAKFGPLPEEGPNLKLTLFAQATMAALPEWRRRHDDGDEDGEDGGDEDDMEEDGGWAGGIRHEYGGKRLPQPRHPDAGEDYPDEETAPLHDVESRRRKKPSSPPAASSRPTLQPLRLGLTPDMTADELMGHREEFLLELRQLVYTIRKNNEPVQEKFSEDECIDIANFFFSEVMGPSSLSRLSHLIQYYMQVDPEFRLDRGVAVRAQLLSQNTSAPTPLRQFFRAFGNVMAGHTTLTTILSSLYKMVHSIKLVKFYLALIREIYKPDGHLRSWLKEQNYQPQKGATWMMVLIQYVTDALDTPAHVWNGTCQMGIGIQGLQKEFGNGILTLLPIATMRK